MPIFPVTGAKYVQIDQVQPSQQSNIDTTKTFDEKLLAKKYTQDTFHNRTALNHSRFDPIIKKLESYSEGAPISVTYYSQITNFANKQSHASDYSYNLSNVHKAYDKINNLELRLNGGFEYSYDDEAAEAMVEGSGKIHPGFKPLVGDIFLYEIVPGQLGLFLITNINPLSLHRGSALDVSFLLKEYVDNDTILKLDQCIVDIYYYHTQKIMGETTTLLKRQDYFDLLKVVNVRKDLIELFINLFYDKNSCSLFRPDEIYDPYLVEFFNRLITFNDSSYYPFSQLCIDEVYDKESILTDLTDGTTSFNFDRYYKYNTKVQIFNILSANINGLHNKEYIDLNNEGEFFYIFSEAYYNNDTSNYSPFEAFLSSYLTSKVVDVPTMLSFLTGIKDVDRLTLFYQIPIIIHMCNNAISSI